MFFLLVSFFSTFRRDETQSVRAHTPCHVRTHVDIHRVSRDHHRQMKERKERKKERERDIHGTGEARREKEKERRGTGARGSRRDRDRFDEESERARAAPKPYTRRSKESSVLSATMVTKRTGRSLSQPPPRSISLSVCLRLYGQGGSVRLA